jgi:hypothetical protein
VGFYVEWLLVYVVVDCATTEEKGLAVILRLLEL